MRRNVITAEVDSPTEILSLFKVSCCTVQVKCDIEEGSFVISEKVVDKLCLLIWLFFAVHRQF